MTSPAQGAPVLALLPLLALRRHHGSSTTCSAASDEGDGAEETPRSALAYPGIS